MAKKGGCKLTIMTPLFGAPTFILREEDKEEVSGKVMQALSSTGGFFQVGTEQQMYVFPTALLRTCCLLFEDLKNEAPNMSDENVVSIFNYFEEE